MQGRAKATAEAAPAAEAEAYTEGHAHAAEEAFYDGGGSWASN